MTRTSRMLERLGKVDPLRDHALGVAPAASDPTPSRRAPRLRLAIGAGLATAIAVALLLAVALNPGDGSRGVVATAAATAAEQPAIEIAEDQFAFRTENWLQASVPGDIAEASPRALQISSADADPAPRTGVREVWFSPRDRGRIEGERGESWARCTAADWVLALTTDEYCWTDIGGPNGVNYLFEQPLMFQRAVMRGAGPMRHAAPFWEFSPDIARLGTDPAKIETAVADLGRQLEGRQGTFNALGNNIDRIYWDPKVDDDPAYMLRAVADLLANPLAPPDVRAALFEYAGTIDGVESSEDATDPEGRSGASISVTSTSADPLPTIVTDLPRVTEDPLSQYAKDGYELDLSGLTFRTEVVFDPDTSELLSESTELVSADDPLFGPWLERQGAPQTIYSRTFEPITVVEAASSRSTP